MKKLCRLYRIGALAGAILLPIGAVLATGTTEALAATSYQYCDVVDGDTPACLNAWGGGPYVNVETTVNSENQNSQFQVLTEPNSYYQIEFVGNGSSGSCVGDAGNVPGNADTGLVPCDTHTGAGWGSVFRETANACNGNPNLIAFYNLHWGGYLGMPAGYVNGSHFYLNKPANKPYCFLQSP